MDCAAWFGSSNGLFLMLGVVAAIGFAAGLGVAAHLPEKVKHFLGL